MDQAKREEIDTRRKRKKFILRTLLELLRKQQLLKMTYAIMLQHITENGEKRGFGESFKGRKNLVRAVSNRRELYLD